MNAAQLVPGISSYPDLVQQLEQRLDRLGAEKCGACARSALSREFRRKLKDRQERDRLTKGNINKKLR